MGSKKVESNSKYQKQMDRSFTIIYHNMKRIQENKTLKAQESKYYFQPCEILEAESSQQLRRQSLDPTGEPHSPSRDRDRPNSVPRVRSHYTTRVSKQTKGRRVSFSVDTATQLFNHLNSELTIECSEFRFLRRKD